MTLGNAGRRHAEAKEAALQRVRKGDMLSPDQSSAVVAYWRAVMRKVERSHEPGKAQAAVHKLRNEMDELCRQRAALRDRINDPAVQSQIKVIDQLLRLLEAILTRTDRHWRLTRLAGWAYSASLSTAFPKKHPLLGRDPRKDKPKPPPIEPKKRDEHEDEDEDDE